MDDENKFMEEIEKLQNSKEGKDHIKLGKYYSCYCFIPINIKKAFEEYKLANELDNKIGYAEISDHFFRFNKERNEEKGIELLEKGISMNDLNSKLKLATYLIQKKNYKESKKLFEELLEQKHYPSYVEYGKEILQNQSFAEYENGIDKIRAMKLILEAANEGTDREAVLYLLDCELFKKEYKKYVNLKFLEDRYFEYKSKLYEDINKKVKIWKQGVKFNCAYCIDELISYHDKYGECPDPKKEEKYLKKGYELNSWSSYYCIIQKYFKNNDMKNVEKYVNQYHELYDSIDSNILEFIENEDIKKTIKFFKKLIKESIIDE
jgi:hypothetical protein